MKSTSIKRSLIIFLYIVVPLLTGKYFFDQLVFGINLDGHIYEKKEDLENITFNNTKLLPPKSSVIENPKYTYKDSEINNILSNNIDSIWIKYFINNFYICVLNNNKISLYGEDITYRYKQSKDAKDAGSLSLFKLNNTTSSSSQILYANIGDNECKKINKNDFLNNFYYVNYKVPIAYNSNDNKYLPVSLDGSGSSFYIRPSYTLYFIFFIFIFYPFYIKILNLYFDTYQSIKKYF